MIAIEHFIINQLKETYERHHSSNMDKALQVSSLKRSQLRYFANRGNENWLNVYQNIIVIDADQLNVFFSQINAICLTFMTVKLV